MIVALILLPALAGSLAFFVKSDRTRRALMVAVAFAHLALVGAAWTTRPGPIFAGWLGLDATGLLVLTLASTLFCAAAVYGVGYLARESAREHGGERKDWDEGFLFTNAPEAVFTGCLLWFLATMSLVASSRHLGILWVAIEATTLTSAPLLYYHRHARSLEATWKYLLLCSVGIGLALLGNFCLEIAQQAAASASPATAMLPAPGSTMLVDVLLQRHGFLHPTWARVAFLCLLVGYGTKMGLAPMHAWLPDAHSEAPSLVSALLSGALLNCAFLGIFRSLQVLGAAGQAGFAGPLLIGFGITSIAFAAVFILGQASFKRMLAWSSVEHMGLIALAIGVGGTDAAMLHAVNHSLTKGMLFLLAGNILGHYKSRATRDVTGLLRALPVTGMLWVMGFLAITGSPPFGPFISEFAILKSCFASGHDVVGVVVLALLVLVFLGMARAVLRMTHGTAPASLAAATRSQAHEPWLAVAPPALFATMVIGLGVYVPPVVLHALHEAAALLGGR